MRLKSFFLAGFLSCIVGITGVNRLSADNTPTTTSVLDALANLKTHGRSSAQEYLHLLEMKRHKLVLVLLSIAKSPNQEVKASAIYLLGMYRGASAVPQLVKEIGFFYPKGAIVKGLPLVLIGAYPAATALARIGMPSVRPILLALQRCSNPRYRSIMVGVLANIEGLAVTRFRLQRMITTAKRSSSKANLKAALADVAQVKGR